MPKSLLKKHKKVDIENATSKISENDPSYSDFNIINVNLAVFSLFLVLVFSYFIYFSNQLSEIKSEILIKIVEINLINPPHPWSFLTITGHKEFYYVKRKEILLNNFQANLRKISQSSLNDVELKKVGKNLQIEITQMAYFFPYKKMLDFKKDGTVSFDPNRFESIETIEMLKTNLPSYSESLNKNQVYDFDFTKKQIDEINYFHSRFTQELVDNESIVVKALSLSDNLKNEYDKIRLQKYISSLIEYLEQHYKLGIPLGLAIKKYDYINNKSNFSLILCLSILLTINFLFGIVLPLFVIKIRYNKILWLIPLLAFVTGVVLLFSESIYAIPG